jgi:hypothetical protein
LGGEHLEPERWIGIVVGLILFTFAPQINKYALRGPVIRPMRPVQEELGAMFARAAGGVFIGVNTIGPPLGGLIGGVVGILVSRMSEKHDRLVLEKDRDAGDEDGPRLPT